MKYTALFVALAAALPALAAPALSERAKFSSPVTLVLNGAKEGVFRHNGDTTAKLKVNVDGAEGAYELTSTDDIPWFTWKADGKQTDCHVNFVSEPSSETVTIDLDEFTTGGGTKTNVGGSPLKANCVTF